MNLDGSVLLPQFNCSLPVRVQRMNKWTSGTVYTQCFFLPNHNKALTWLQPEQQHYLLLQFSDSLHINDDVLLSNDRLFPWHHTFSLLYGHLQPSSPLSLATAIKFFVCAPCSLFYCIVLQATCKLVYEVHSPVFHFFFSPWLTGLVVYVNCFPLPFL